MPAWVARVALAFLPGKPEKAVLWVLIILTLPVTLLALLFAGPVVIWERVPIATPGQVKIYVDAAGAVSASTRSPCDQGVTVDWQPLLAIDAVRLNQDFSKASPAKAGELARRFIEKVGTCTYCVGDPPECTTYPVYKLRSLEEVLDDLGFNQSQRKKVKNILEVDLSFLLDVGPGVPPGWMPVEGKLKWPTPGIFTITSGFGPRVDPVEGLDGFHTGMDIGAPMWTPVHAVADGVVAVAEWMGNFGYAVYIEHDDMVTIYAHLSQIAVQRGQQVRAGDVIAYSGSTGKSTGPHLHFEIRVHGQPVNPINYFK
ncbi:Duplicated hybrid motif [Moorella glycerini]|uniref:Murein DD-endopeptidase MepM n=1 Tax=Neomoorella stamsii TaxID=1266720 RepID=A0A9X7P778_9FIRM|nr:MULTISPECIES: M23 family metallopeptidase [Moorella]PRR76317.1 Murein DD-endopeptidase MepM [Moorella stamsii]CEP67115.1 Duplicated hybrid motif [Moorella glycerini]